jgi:hypothetical protein
MLICGERPSADAWVHTANLLLRVARDPSPLALREFDSQVAHAELTEQISEFYALGIQAILAMAQRSESAVDYLDMAELVATPDEESLVAKWRAVYERFQASDQLDGFEHCTNIMPEHEIMTRNRLLFVLQYCGVVAGSATAALQTTQAA